MKARLPSSYCAEVRSNGENSSFLLSLLGLAIMRDFSKVNRVLKGNNTAIVNYSRCYHDQNIFKKFKLYHTLSNPGSIYGINYDICGIPECLDPSIAIKDGDDLGSIAKMLGCSVADLKSYRANMDANTIEETRELGIHTCETLTALGVFAQFFPIVLSGLTSEERKTYLEGLEEALPFAIKETASSPITQSMLDRKMHVYGDETPFPAVIWDRINESWFKWYLLTPVTTIKQLSDADTKAILHIYHDLLLLCFIFPPARDLLTFIFTEGNSPCRYLKCGDMLINRLYLESLNGICSVDGDGLTLDVVLGRLKQDQTAWKNVPLHRIMTYTSVTHSRTKPLSVNLWHSLLSTKTWSYRYNLLGQDLRKMGNFCNLNDIVRKIDSSKGDVTAPDAEMTAFKRVWGTICDAWDYENVIARIQYERDMAILELGYYHRKTVNQMQSNTDQVAGTLTAERLEAAKKLSRERNEKNKLIKENESLRKKVDSLTRGNSDARVKSLEAEIAKYRAQIVVLEKRVNDSEIKASKAGNHIKTLENNSSENETLKKRISSLEAHLNSTLDLLAMAEAEVDEDNTEITQNDLAELSNISASIVLPDMPALRKLVYQMPNSHISFVNKTGKLTDIGCNKDFYFIATRRCSHKHYYFWDSVCRRAKYKQYKFHSSSYNAICHELIRISRELAKQSA